MEGFYRIQIWVKIFPSTLLGRVHYNLRRIMQTDTYIHFNRNKVLPDVFCIAGFAVLLDGSLSYTCYVYDMFYERLRTGKNRTRGLEFRFREICTIWYSKVKRENILRYIVFSYDINCLLRRNVIEIFVDSFLVFQPVLSAKLV